MYNENGFLKINKDMLSAFSDLEVSVVCMGEEENQAFLEEVNNIFPNISFDNRSYGTFLNNVFDNKMYYYYTIKIWRNGNVACSKNRYIGSQNGEQLVFYNKNSEIKDGEYLSALDGIKYNKEDKPCTEICYNNRYSDYKFYIPNDDLNLEHEYKFSQGDGVLIDLDEDEYIIPEDNEDAYYTPSEAEDLLFYCQHCGRYYEDTSTFMVYHDNEDYDYLCEGCFEDMDTFYCECCDRYFYTDEVGHDEDYYCEYCTPDSDWEEEPDDDYYDNTDTPFTNPSTQPEAKYNPLVQSYHYGGDDIFKYHGEVPNSEDEWYGLGVELEMDGESPDYECADILREKFDKDGSMFLLTRDSSLDQGFELVTHPYTEKAFFELPWEDLLNTMLEHHMENEFSSAGMHMHFSRAYFGTNDADINNSVAKLLYFFNKNYDEIYKMSGRSGSNSFYSKMYPLYDQLQYMSRTDNQAQKERIFGEIISSANSICIDGESNHHACINTCRSHNTVEIRMMGSTLNYRDFIARVKFNIMLVKNCTRIPWSKIDDMELWFKGMSQETKDLCLEKEAFCGLLPDEIKEEDVSDFSPSNALSFIHNF